MFPLLLRSLLLILLWLLLWTQPLPLRAQQPPPVPPWRQALTCDQTFRGLEYCTDNGSQIHVLVIDTHSPGVRLEYMIAEGVNSAGVFVECNDVNVPQWGPVRGGCAEPNNPAHYPVTSLEWAAELTQERHGQVAVVINSDYGACYPIKPSCNQGHGPEGLTVVRGERLDGPANGDFDQPIPDPNLNNAVRRPWLAVSLNGPLQVAIGQIELDADRGDKPYDWVYTGVGGGPWLIQNGQVDDAQIEKCPGMNGTHPCVSAVAQTGVGLSQDGRWLYLVVMVGQDAKGLAHFLRDDLNVWNAIKFDGGGSSQLWYNGQIIADGDGRQLSQYLAVIAPPGSGIEIANPSPEPLPEQGNFLERLWRTLERETQKAWETIRVRGERFLAEQWERLQREVGKQLAEWQVEIERWWSEQQQRLEREADRQAGKALQEVCGGNLLIGMLVLGAIIGRYRYIGIHRKRRNENEFHVEDIS